MHNRPDHVSMLFTIFIDAVAVHKHAAAAFQSPAEYTLQQQQPYSSQHRLLDPVKLRHTTIDHAPPHHV